MLYVPSMVVVPSFAVGGGNQSTSFAVGAGTQSPSSAIGGGTQSPSFVTISTPYPYQLSYTFGSITAPSKFAIVF